jgi:hypothetical protein
MIFLSSEAWKTLVFIIMTIKTRFIFETKHKLYFLNFYIVFCLHWNSWLLCLLISFVFKYMYPITRCADSFIKYSAWLIHAQSNVLGYLPSIHILIYCQIVNFVPKNPFSLFILLIEACYVFREVICLCLKINLSYSKYYP